MSQLYTLIFLKFKFKNKIKQNSMPLFTYDCFETRSIYEMHEEYVKLNAIDPELTRYFLSIIKLFSHIYRVSKTENKSLQTRL